ncbi:MAG: glycosyltransferase family 9 protein [Candidatus Omnitrophica bacterium]|nr:glycosyltransferase family 9 protein [Candidatus Omnitrophota bacterium]
MKILVIEMSNLGDAILTYPALSALWERYPDAGMHVLASPRNRELFEGDARVRRVWVMDRHSSFWGQAATIARLFAARFDLVVDFRNSLIPLLLFPRRRTPILRGGPAPVHRAGRHLALVTALGIPPPPRVQPLPFGPEEEARASRWVEPGRPVVIIAPGSRSHLKRWAADRYARVADRLVADHSAQILLVGDAEERVITEQVRRAMKQPAADLAGSTTLRDLAALLARAALLITNDSATLHAAEVMRVPAVAIFGPTDERKYGPRDPRSAVIRRALVCAPCEKALCPYHHECMALITPDEIYEAAARIITGRLGNERANAPRLSAV